MSKNRSLLLLLAAAILLIAAALRFHRLGEQSFWNDEGNSARLSERSIPLILEGTASDVHPPLYYLLLRGWRELAGDSEFGLRALSAFLGVGATALTLALGRLFMASRPAGFLLGGLLAAIHPALVYYSQEARMYQALAFWGLLSTWLLFVWLRQKRSSPRLYSVPALAYLLAAAGGLYTHYFFPTILLAHGLMVCAWLLWRERPPAGAYRQWGWRLARRTLSWLALVAGAGLLYLPWTPIFLDRAGGAGRELGWPAVGDFLPAVARWLVLGETAADGLTGPLWAAAFLLLLAIFLPGGQGERREGRLLLLLGLATPILFLFVAGLVRPAYFKFLTPAVPFLALLVSLAVVNGWRLLERPAIGRYFLRFALILLTGFLVWGQAESLANMYGDPAYQRADYRGLAARIVADNHPDAGIILNAPNQWEVFTYYYQADAPVYPLPRGHPDPQQIETELRQIAGRHQRLYAIFWGEGERDPERLVERWLDAHAFKATDEWVGDLRFVIYAVPEEPAGEMAVAVNLPFGKAIVLQGYSVTEASLLPGDIIQVALFWQATAPLERRYKVFLHLVDEAGNLVAQRDSEPGGGLALTTTWQPGETIIDNHGLLVPADLPAGRYTLLVGLYDLFDPAARLPIATPDGVADAWALPPFLVGDVGD